MRTAAICAGVWHKRHKICKKALAIAIVKALDNDNEVEDFFEKIDEGE